MSILQHILKTSCRCAFLGYQYKPQQLKQSLFRRHTIKRLIFSQKSTSTQKKEGRHQITQKQKVKNMQTSSILPHPSDSVSITFIDRNGERMKVEADIGDTLLDVAKDNDIDGVEGACGGTLACSTCHCIFKQEDFDRLRLDDIDEEELDMLDLAYGLTDTSRLVCSIDVTEEMDGLVITVPTATTDARNI